MEKQKGILAEEVRRLHKGNKNNDDMKIIKNVNCYLVGIS